IEPEEGKFDEKEIEHYRKVIKALRARGLEPFVTLWHWTLPIWLAEKGGWLNKNAPKYFERYVSKIVASFSDVKFWITLNEPAVYTSLGTIKGTQPPGNKSIFKAARTRANLIKAQKSAYNAIHSISDSALVGVGNSANFFIPYKNKIYNKILAKIISYLEGGFFKKIKKNIDYVAFQYYRSIEMGFRLGGNFLGIIENNLDTGGERTDLGWKIYPEGIYHFLKNLQKYNKPIYITENGLADAKDEKREKFIKEHLYWVHKAIKDGVDVKGYFHWSLIDNFEFVEIRGFWPRFGLVEVDFKTQERKIRPSAYEYAKICKNNKLEI
ncbi:family 1 glycosylhydrolase, partial [Patescibacteria group bacterium]|nr:family 1 glycosylhydrolase [Patescibacteria group bacterium]